MSFSMGHEAHKYWGY